MTPEEQQKADAWMLLQTGDVVHQRILDTFRNLFNSKEACRYVSRKLTDAETSSYDAPLRMYFEGQLERNLRLILAEGVQDKLTEIMYPMIDEAVKRHAELISKDLAELKKLKSKGPIGRRY